jgi:hypothetical protein
VGRCSTRRLTEKERARQRRGQRTPRPPK